MLNEFLEGLRSMMMSDYFDGFAGSILTAIVMIVVPFLARRHAIKIVNTTAPEAFLPTVTGYIVKSFGAIEISEAKRFVVRFNEIYTFPHLDFTMAYGTTKKSENFFSGEDIWVVLTLPGVVKSERHEKIFVGWNHVFKIAATEYRLTLAKIDSLKLMFELRVFNKT